MTETTLNILDLTQSKPTLGNVGLLESLGQTNVQNSEQSEISFDMIFGNMLAGSNTELLGQEEVVKQNPLVQNALVNDTPVKSTFVQNALVSEDQTLIEQTEVAKNIQTFNKELNELLPQNNSTQNINIKEIFANQNKELENGQFKVISQEIVDSKLSLTIESTNGKQITVSLPIDSLQNSKVDGLQQRVSLQDSYYKRELESLIEKVNIKQIEVKSIDGAKSDSPLKPVEISLLGEQNSAVVTLKASLKKNQIKITENSTASTQKAAVLDESTVWDEKVVVNTNQSNKLIENVSPQTKQQVVQTSLNGEQLQVKNSITNQSTERTDSIFNLYKSDALESAETKENIQNIRMQLPENIKSVLRPNGQAVVIKMNPANLGPAKLSLSLSGGKLRAKLIVSSVNAKQVLDSSMNRLVDQLQKSDIIVDKIEVTLDENQNQNEHFNNQKQQWQKKMSYKNIDLNQFEQNEIEQSVQRPMISALQPITSGSVNFLA